MLGSGVVTGSESLGSFALQGLQGRFFLLPSLLPHPETPPPSRGKILNEANPVDRGWAVSIPFSPSSAGTSVWDEEIEKFEDEKGCGRGPGKAARSRRVVAALPRNHRCFPPGPGARRPSPGRSGVCVSGFPRKGLRSGSRRGNAGVGAAGAVKRRLAFFVDF